MLWRRRQGGSRTLPPSSRFPAESGLALLAALLIGLSGTPSAAQPPTDAAVTVTPVASGTQDTLQALKLSGFFGKWHGLGTAESRDDPYFRLTARDLDVTIAAPPPEADAADGFSVTWTTLSRDSGSSMQPTWRTRSAALLFKPTEQANVWREAHSTDPLRQPYAWAQLVGHTLTMYLLTIPTNGGVELQVYERTVVGDTMQLLFTRFSNDDNIRTVKARLTRTAAP